MIIKKKSIRVNKKSKRTKKKKKNLKIQNLIASTKSRVLKNTKIYQPKQRCKKNKNKNQPKKLRERERERDNLFCEEKLFKEWKKE